MSFIVSIHHDARSSECQIRSRVALLPFPVISPDFFLLIPQWSLVPKFDANCLMSWIPFRFLQASKGPLLCLMHDTYLGPCLSRNEHVECYKCRLPESTILFDDLAYSASLSVCVHVDECLVYFLLPLSVGMHDKLCSLVSHDTFSVFFNTNKQGF